LVHAATGDLAAHIDYEKSELESTFEHRTKVNNFDARTK
jgi:hypothetical protein